MPLQNRVDPFGELFADPARGQFMGNRGGRLHAGARTLGRRRWVTRAWICCRLEFHGRHRQVWGDGYTELFFLDEATALAAGHRPCFECRRGEAKAFAEFWRRAFGLSARLRAADMDRVLHAERLDGRNKRLHRSRIDDLPDGALVALEEGAFALRAERCCAGRPRAGARMAARAASWSRRSRSRSSARSRPATGLQRTRARISPASPP
jgi:hypothetical protein